jgi:hypothetical protein
MWCKGMHESEWGEGGWWNVLRRGDSSWLWVKLVNELCLLFLRQRFMRLPSSTVSLAIGTSQKLSRWKIVSRYVYLRMTWRAWTCYCSWRVQSGVRVGGDGRRGWWNMVRKGDSIWLWMKFAFLSCHSIISGFFCLLFWCWLWMKSAFFSCDSVWVGIWLIRLVENDLT